MPIPSFGQTSQGQREGRRPYPRWRCPKGSAGKGEKGKAKGEGKGARKEAEKNKFICFKFMDGLCTDAKCTFDHRAATPEELKAKKAFEARRASSPAAPAAQEKQVCPEWVSKGECSQGKACKLAHPQKKKGKGAKA